MKKTLPIFIIAFLSLFGVVAISAVTGSVGVSGNNSDLEVEDPSADGGSFLEFTASNGTAPGGNDNTGGGTVINANGTFTSNNGLETYPATTEAGRYTAEQIVYATGIQKQGPYNPSRGAPWGLHDAPIFLPQAWDFSQGAKSNPGAYQEFFRPAMEWRGAVFVENNARPPQNVIVQVRNPQYWSFTNGSWQKEFDVTLKGSGSGAYLAGNPVGTDPFTGGQHFGGIQWQNIGNNTFQAPFVGPQAMHFWRGDRYPIQNGQTAELAVAEMRIIGANGQAPDTTNKLLAQIGIDYYNFGENNSRAPGPGIGRYQQLTDEWSKLAWVTSPPGTPITFDANVAWLNNNPPPVLAQ